jgi:FlaA1/EpsC-like NDP-sugar epimerase
LQAVTGRVFITGGAGFLARAIYLRARAEKWDCTFTALVRRGEQQAMLNGRFPEVHVSLADIGASSVETLAGYMSGHDILIHAAAVKHVDLAELSAWDTVRVNVDGSRNVANAAIRAGLKHAVAISTDKAVRPANIYGASKMTMERLWMEADQLSATEFRTVRYGNVVASSGSVIPKFQAEYRATGKVSVTDPAMSRYWMTHNDAIDCILASLTLAQRGTITIPEPEAALLATIVSAAGIPERDWKFIGLRPGEKVDEMLIAPEECPRTSILPGLFGDGPNGRYYEMMAPGHNSFTAITDGLCSADAKRIDADTLMAMIEGASLV